jgi:branched-chain amino acid aminotransferase
MKNLSVPSHIYFNDKVVEWSAASIHVWTEVVLRAASVFEGVRGYWHPEERRHYWVMLGQHVDRLHKSATVMRIPCDLTVEQLASQLAELILKLRYTRDVYARPTVFVEKGRYTSMIESVGYFMPIFESERGSHISQGATCCVSSWRRSSDESMPAAIKAAANYANFRWARMEAEDNGYDEAILLNSSGRVSETGGSAIFVIREGVAFTPPLSESILPSITRRAAIRLFAEIEVPTYETCIQRADLYLADEIFLAGTLDEITPVVSVDRMDIGTGQPGPLTMAVRDRYIGACRGGRHDHRGWLTAGPVIA